MISELLLPNQIDRNELIKSYGFVEQLSSNKNFLQEYLELASRICGAEMAYISLLDDKKQYILSQHQSELKTIDIKDSICQHTIKRDDILIIENTMASELTTCLPQVNIEDGIKFYAGYPLSNENNINIGAICVMDKEEKTLSQNQKDTLKVLARQIMTTLDNQRSLIKLIKKINSNFKPAACSNLNCLHGELAHLQDEVVDQNKLIKEQKLSLENANEKLLNFANMVAHDVRAPLRTISSFVGLHEKQLQKSSVSYEKKYLDFVNQATSNLDNLTQGLLGYAKSDADSTKNEKINLNQILESVKLNLADEINSLNAEIIIPKDTFHINGKKIQLIQLFQNLISNGLKYQNGKELPQIIIEAKEIKSKVRISVIDNGIGISKDNLEKIFEPFKRLHTNKEYSGSGIGLATCKRIIENLDSEFHVTSELGKGSSFNFDLPIFY